MTQSHILEVDLCWLRHWEEEQIDQADGTEN